jgi:hypothetical protein
MQSLLTQVYETLRDLGTATPHDVRRNLPHAHHGSVASTLTALLNKGYAERTGYIVGPERRNVSQYRVTGKEYVPYAPRQPEPEPAKAPVVRTMLSPGWVRVSFGEGYNPARDGFRRPVGKCISTLGGDAA